MNNSNQTVVEVIINKQTYRVSCAKGEEEHIRYLSEVINKEVMILVGSIGQVGENRLLFMASLIIADKMFNLEKGSKPNESKEKQEIKDIIEKTSKRIESIALRLTKL